MITLHRAVAGLILGLGLFSREDPDVAKGNALYQEGKYQEAADAYAAAQAKTAQERRRIAFNRGTALLKAGEAEKARDLLLEAQGDDDKTLRSRAAFNEGNAAFAMKDPQAAANAYRKSLLADLSYEPARRNLELALLALDRPDAGQPEGGQGDGGDDNADGGDKNKDGGSSGQDGGAGDGGNGAGDSGGSGGDGGNAGQDAGANGDGGQQASSSQKPEPQPQEITKQDAVKLLDALRDAEQDQMLMRFLQQEATAAPTEKNW